MAVAGAKVVMQGPDQVIEERDRYVMLARYKGYKNDFQGALDTLDEAIEKYPDYGPLYRHRAHRLITFREFDRSIADSERAIELCGDWPDEIEYYQKELVSDVEALFLGQLDRVNFQRPRVTPEIIEALKDTYKSTLHSSIWYHYGLAFYLKGDYERSIQEYSTALTKAIDDDMRVASSDWIYMSYRRLGDAEGAEKFLAELPADLHVNESSYHRRIQMYRGQIEPEQLLAESTKDPKSLVTQGYGLGNWYFYNGQREKAAEVFSRIVEVGVTNAFGHIAAERDLRILEEEK